MIGRPLAIALLATAAACQPAGDAPDAPECPVMPLATGEVSFGPLVCSAQRVTGGDGRGEDWWLANSRLRVIMRHPNAALTLAGLGGGTLVDAAPWTRADGLLEVAPLVDGGWLSVDDAEVEDDAIRLEGTLRALPYRAIPDEGERRTARWRIGPDEPWVHVEGASGLWIHPNSRMQLLDGWLVGDRLVYGHDGDVVEDLGGAIVAHGATALLVADVDTAWAERPGPLQALSGMATGADTVRMYRGGAWVGTLLVKGDGTFGATVPADVDGLTAHAASHAPSPLTTPGQPLELGPQGDLDLTMAGLDRPFMASWAARDGRSGAVAMPPEGGSLPLGAGVFTLTLTAGPAWTPRTLDVEITPGSRAAVSTTLTRRVDAGSWVLADLAWPASRDRGVREGTNDRTSIAAASGRAFVVEVARDDVATANAWLDDQQFIQWSTGATLTSPAGWSITAWPWSDSPRQSGHGAPRVDTVDPRTALHLAWGGPGTARDLLVDLPWLRAVTDAPWAVDPRPSHARLGPPGAPPFGAWYPWFAWLDASRFVLPVGDVAWLDVRTPERYGPVELGRAIHLGRICAGTGPLLTLDVDGAGAGEVLPPAQLPPDTGGPTPPVERRAHLRLQRGGARVDELTLLTAGRGVVGAWTVDRDDLTVDATFTPGPWTIAVAWSAASADWAVTAPLWDVLPAERLPGDTDPADTDPDSDPQTDPPDTDPGDRAGSPHAPP